MALRGNAATAGAGQPVLQEAWGLAGSVALDESGAAWCARPRDFRCETTLSGAFIFFWLIRSPAKVRHPARARTSKRFLAEEGGRIGLNLNALFPSGRHPSSTSQVQRPHSRASDSTWLEMFRSPPRHPLLETRSLEQRQVTTHSCPRLTTEPLALAGQTYLQRCPVERLSQAHQRATCATRHKFTAARRRRVDINAPPSNSATSSARWTPRATRRRAGGPLRLDGAARPACPWRPNRRTNSPTDACSPSSGPTTARSSRPRARTRGGGGRPAPRRRPAPSSER